MLRSKRLLIAVLVALASILVLAMPAQATTYNDGATKQKSLGNGLLKSYFSDSYVGPCIVCITQHWIVNGDSHAFWSGSTPSVNADKIQLTDKFQWNGLGVSVSASNTGGGGTVSTTSSSMTIALDPIKKTWQVNHYYTGVEASTKIAFTSLDHWTTSTFYFGNNVYTVIATTNEACHC